MIEKIDLSGEWKFLLSEEMPDLDSELSDTITLPSTVSQAKKPPLSSERSDGFLNDPYKFEGYALYSRTTVFPALSDDEELFFVMERTRTSRVWINGKEAGTQNSLCAVHRYNITDLAKPGENTVTVMTDNVSCPVPGGHMTSQDTQTNWLGVVGEICAVKKAKCRFENIRLFPDVNSETVTVKGTVTGGGELALTVQVDGFPGISVKASGETELVYSMKGAKLWSEHSPALYTMKITSGSDVSEITFGMRNFEAKGKDFLLNGEKIYLRGKHDGMIFPLTGAAPADKESWLKVMGTAKEYGINHYRFHTCCPPEAAFRAADELGIYLEPELPFWGTVEETPDAGQLYLIEEGFRMLEEFGNHPSFFAMSMGNELWGSKERLNEIIGGYKALDSRHLYTQGSNNFQFWPCVVDNDDFFVGVRFSKERLFRGSYAMCDAPLGHIQTAPPDSDYDYDEHIRPASARGEKSGGGAIEIQYGTGVKTVYLEDGSGEFIPAVPVVSHEVGQYFMYPDYGTLGKYTGVLKPFNLEIFRERLEEAGLEKLADKYFRASGRFAAECYRFEIETALRSKELSGFQLLDLQDFTGQGTALVGILDPFMDNKGVISAEEWRRFCSERVLLGCLAKFVFRAGEHVEMPVKLYNYSSASDDDPSVKITLSISPGAEWDVCGKGSFRGGLFELGTAEFDIPDVKEPVKAVLSLNYKDISNNYILWVYPETDVSGVNFTSDWKEAKARLAKGESVLFLPDSLPEDKSVEGTYCTDFWNYPMFSSISKSMNKPLPAGTLGLLADTESPALKGFPTEIYSSAQWYDAVTSSRAAILDGTGLDTIVRTIDNCGRNHSLGDIFEVNAGEGKLLVCTFRLDKKTDSLPCARLLRCLSDYVSSGDFAPAQTADISVLADIFE